MRIGDSMQRTPFFCDPITESNRIYLVLFSMPNRHLFLIWPPLIGPSSEMHPPATQRTPFFCDPITESNRIYLVLFGMQNRAFGPYLAAINRILVSGMRPPATHLCR
jgi:hypothetical protein